MWRQVEGFGLTLASARLVSSQVPTHFLWAVALLSTALAVGGALPVKANTPAAAPSAIPASPPTPSSTATTVATPSTAGPINTPQGSSSSSPSGWPAILLSGLAGALAAAFLVKSFDWVTTWLANRRRFQAALIVVLDELQANLANLNIVEGDPHPAETLHLVDGSYRNVELVVAERLNPDLRATLGEAYVPVRVPRSLFQLGPAPAGMEQPMRLIPANLDAAREHMRAARNGLRGLVNQQNAGRWGNE